MRHIFFIMVLAVFFTFLNGCATGGRDLIEASLPEGYETRVFEVFGMDCPGCHGAVEKLVKKVPSVLEAKANWKKKQLIVYLSPDSELKDENVYEAIRSANFTVGKRIK